MANANELWIDLESLVSCSHYDDGFAVFDYDYTHDDEPADDTIHYLLRIALRALGYKIRKIEDTFGDKLVDGEWVNQLIYRSYHTSIPKEEGNRMTEIWNQYCGEIFEELN